MLIPLLLALAQAPKLITLEIPGGRTLNVCRKLSEATGESYRVAGSVADDVLCLRLAGVPDTEVRARIAQAVAGEWHKDKDVWLLKRTAATEDKQEAGERALRAETARASIVDEMSKLRPWNLEEARSLAVLSTQLSKVPSETPTDQKIHLRALSDMSRRGPAGRALLRILNLLDPAIFGELGIADNWVFSDQPKPRQRKLPQVDAILRDYNKEQADWVDQMARYPAAEEPFKLLDPRSSSGREPAVRAVLILNRGFANDHHLIANLRLVNAQGWIVGQARGFPGTYQARGSAKLDPSLPDPPLPKSPIVRQTYGGKPTIWETDPVPDATLEETAAVKALRELLLRPEESDPLGVTVGPILVSCAALRGENLVALLSDPLLGVFYLDSLTKVRTPSAALAAFGAGGLQIEEANGWITAADPEPSQSRKTRMDRTELGSLLRLASANGFVSLDSATVFWAAQRIPAIVNYAETSWMFGAIGIAGGVGGGEDLDGADVPFFRIIAKLRPAERAEILSGGSIKLYQMPPAAQKELLNFADATHFEVLGLFRPTDPKPNPLYPLGHIRRESTEVLPNRLPPDTTLSCSATPIEILRVHLHNHRSRTFESTGLGYFGSRVEQFQYEPGTAMNLKFHIDFGGLAESDEDAQDVKGFSPGGARDWKSLSDEQRRGILADVERMRALPKQGGTPPP